MQVEVVHLLSTAFQHFFIVLSIRPSQVSTQALRRLIGQLDAVLQKTDGQGTLQQWGWLCRQEQPVVHSVHRVIV